ncbi:HAD-IB family hydrolase [Paenibacillus endoradicis]|uniref:HAD-IB family hydrolase n=1 Tax=Paenibacillus endoradicis TaxID=2972487 RepID=UPI002159344D|nr:HAD-IB family hydrolase [Paenibacillus endoradicis]MCR8659655.1 HAD-IB family hydrolase [Paenibacillus endoradicis]
MEKKIAIFDIDETIIKKDSMFLFVIYGLKKKPWTVFNLFTIGVVTVLYKLKLMKVEKVKGSFFYAIRFFEETDLENFYNDVLVRNLYQDALQELQVKKEAGYHVLLVSASPHAYVKYFNNLPCVDAVIGTELIQRNGRYTNEIEGNNCKGEEKVVRIRQYLADNDLQIDYEQSCAYSDSLTDMPMFKLVKTRYLINKHSHGLEELNWRT